MTMSIKNLFDKEIERTGALIGEQHRLNPRGIKMFGELPPDPLEALSNIQIIPTTPPKEALKKNNFEVVDMSQYRRKNRQVSESLF